jgi:exodeoxyribonuclease VII large subunit
VGAPIDLFAAASPEGAWTVSDVTRRARAIVEAGLPPLWVKGEVSGFKAYGSGHWYFTLRDRVAQLRCVMWSRDNQRLPAPPADGMQVFAMGTPTVWEERGEFRLTVRHLLSTEADGLWQLALEKARAALRRDGLLDPARKRTLPPFPRRIAVVTSRDGAAFRDIVAVAARRWPAVEILLVPTRVQGDGAERDVCAALALLGRIPDLDVVIVGRGGGSKEDLWTFNSERVARALAAVPVPVISAVGHETDVTLCDLVADVRAATPSAAAEAATPDRVELQTQVDRLAVALVRALAAPTRHGGERLARVGDRLSGAMGRTLERLAARLTATGARLDGLSPLRVLERGYAVARDADGRVLRHRAQFPPGLPFRLRVRDGDVDARVEDGGP